MAFLSKAKIYGVLQGVSVFLFGLYVQSLSDGKVIIIGKFLNEETDKDIRSHSFLVLIIFGILMLTFYILSHTHRKKKAETLLYNRLCNHIFDQCIRPHGQLQDSDCKVSFLKVGKTMTLKRDYVGDMTNGKKAPLVKIDDCVYVCGRHQKKQGRASSNVKFLKNQGVAGKCYAENAVVNKVISKYNINQPQNYMDDSFNVLNLPKRKVKKLNEKPASILCIPVTYFKSDQLIGVLSIDSVNGTIFDGATVRQIEQMISTYQAIFDNQQ